MQPREVLGVDDTHEREERQLSPEERRPEAQPEIADPGTEFPIPFVATTFDYNQDIGVPGLYTEVGKPEIAQTRPFCRLIVHHKDILLNHLPRPRFRANSIFF